MDQLIEETDYQRQVREIRTRLDALVIPETEEAVEAGIFLQDLSKLWSVADLEDRHRLLMLMLDAVYVDIVTTRKIVGIAPKPGFRRLFEMVVTTAKESGVTILTPPKTEPKTGKSRTKKVVVVETGGS